MSMSVYVCACDISLCMSTRAPVYMPEWLGYWDYRTMMMPGVRGSGVRPRAGSTYSRDNIIVNLSSS